MSRLISYNVDTDSYSINNDVFDITELQKSYQNNTPFPHIVISSAIDQDMLNDIAEEVNNFQPKAQKKFYGSIKKFSESKIDILPKKTQKLLAFLNSDEFLKGITRITGIDNLISDPNYEGGGIHRTHKGGFLKVHTDFNWSFELKAYRRVNVIIYLNKDWKDDWGGECEFWSYDRETEVKKVKPLFNNLVIFDTNDFTFHGHPFPLKCPKDCSRDSIAVYYYTKHKDSNYHKRKSMETTYAKTRDSDVNMSLFDKLKRITPSIIKKLVTKKNG